MNRVTTTLAIAAAFAAGCGVTHLLRPAYAAETIATQVIHTGDLEGDGPEQPARPAAEHGQATQQSAEWPDQRPGIARRRSRDQ